MEIRKYVSAASLIIAAQSAIGQVINIPQSALLPLGDPGQDSWVAGDAGISGPTNLKIVVEASGTGLANFCLLDMQDNGFPAPPPGGVTDDVLLFSPEAEPGAMTTVDIPTNSRIALFHDVFDETGEFLSGPNGVLNQNPVPGTSDAYLSSNTAHNYTIVGRHQLVKYYIVNPSHAYQFTSQWGVESQLGSGFRAFIFMDDDHSPNYDYDDMIVGVLAPPCSGNAECDDGDVCTGVETCVEGVCQAGAWLVCEDGDFCNGAEICVAGVCEDGVPPTCDDGHACTADSCGPGQCVHAPNSTLCPDDGIFCNGVESCDAQFGCVSSGSPCAVGIICDEEADLCRECQQNADCADTDPCTVGHACIQGSCIPPTPVNCSAAGSDCIEASCDPAGLEGNCDILTPVQDGTVCDDGDECTIDAECEAGHCHGLHAYELAQWNELVECLAGPIPTMAVGCECWDLDGDNHIDLHDASVFQSLFVAP